jgi:hypothetical protein
MRNLVKGWEMQSPDPEFHFEVQRRPQGPVADNTGTTLSSEDISS